MKAKDMEVKMKQNAAKEKKINIFKKEGNKN